MCLGTTGKQPVNKNNPGQGQDQTIINLASSSNSTSSSSSDSARPNRDVQGQPLSPLDLQGDPLDSIPLGDSNRQELDNTSRPPPKGGKGNPIDRNETNRNETNRSETNRTEPNRDSGRSASQRDTSVLEDNDKDDKIFALHGLLANARTQEGEQAYQLFKALLGKNYQ